ncbi:hypothetical protein JWG41_14825 [Leptospira sp. 201903075]|uniref:hypothetical protein n=1 Tax=Leptospira chreensis TaxID=2810035 RepID=UPI00196680C7|nr:hypothetical protein [Leptospira chreensis]MBM9591728.1 hypothetical protein [Leptospira chreensis]
MTSDTSGKNTKFVRVWRQLNVEDVKKQLLYIDDLYGTCGNCKKLGLNYLKDKKCPDCGVTFKYLATKLSKVADIGKILSRIDKEGLELTLIEREDFERSSASDAARDLFKS